MSEDNAKNLDADSTNPLPFEEFVRRHLALLIKQGNELREQQVKFREKMNSLREFTKGEVMSEDSVRNLDVRSTDQLPFEEFVRKQFELVFVRLDRLEIDLRAEMVERFLQLSRQIKDLDLKVNVFIREQTYSKDDVRELREERLPKV